MEVEKRGVKGGFFQLFDWNGKSRKRLFSGKAEFSESSNQGIENYHGSFIQRHQQGLEKGFPTDPRSQKGYHYASSANSDSENGTKPPGVVARLMGLDSLPSSKINEPCFTPSFIESHSSRDSAAAFQGEQHDIVIIESMRNKLDGFSRNPLDMRGRHLERFQTEVLPPKFAKPISVAHNRLLSPIKGPGFIPPRNAAYIIEAAAKIIEQSPRSASKVSRFPSLGSSSVPFGVQDMKVKVEAASRRPSRLVEKSKDQIFTNPKKPVDTRGKSRSQDSCVPRGSSEESKRSILSQRSKTKEKQGSFAVQAKTNIKRRDGSSSLANRSSEKPKDPPNMQKKSEMKTPSSRRNQEALRQNNQKQNRAFSVEDETLGSSKEGKESSLSANSYVNDRAKRTVNKIVVSNVVSFRKTNFVVADPGKEILSSSGKMNSSKRKMTANRNTEQIQVEKPSEANVEFKGDSKWDELERKDNSSDVVSFTFTSPIKKSGGGSSLCSTGLEASSSYSPDCNTFAHKADFRSSAEMPLGFNVGGDALSVLLEQKLKELASRVGMSQDLSEVGSLSNSVNSCGNTSTLSLLKPLPSDIDTCKSKCEIQFHSDCSSVDQHGLEVEKEKKGLPSFVDIVGDNNSNFDSQGPVSFSRPSLSAATSDSSDVDRSSSNEGMISDTASSLSVSFLHQTAGPTLYGTIESEDCSHWELQYIRDVLNGAELLLEEFALGRAHRIIAPELFDQLENKNRYFYKDTEKDMLERKVLFDYVCECFQASYSGLLAGSHKLWVKQTTLVQKRQFLADGLYREISSLANDEEMMVDELVNRDMSSKEGKWVDFESEGFEESIEIEEKILTCLVDELVDDFLF
ncbi:RHO guanyl-nucleotide exchange factor 3 [Striga asiatica]|uniref:RHO guanyl-nucleotide exchange factor 3 n=1 Tax=Striga asiatica TaxID=4170 RepID=A0A5A7QJ43_STRAF|nr:RHO guanyl-nucleotide exchange factor 3 [Striga asiatica]